MNNAGFKYFESQEPDEEIIFIVRRHWLALNTPYYLGGLLTFFGLFLFFIIRNNRFFALNDFWLSIQSIVFGVLFIFLLTFVFTSWVLNYLDILILTSKRVVVIEQNTLFSRKVSALDLDSIQDVSITEKGFFQTVLGMGEVYIQTAGEMPNFQYKNIANPDDLQLHILRAKEAHKQKHLSPQVPESQS